MCMSKLHVIFVFLSSSVHEVFCEWENEQKRSTTTRRIYKNKEEVKNQLMWWVFTQHPDKCVNLASYKWYFIIGFSLNRCKLFNMHKLYRFRFRVSVKILRCLYFVFAFLSQMDHFEHNRCNIRWHYRLDLDDSIWFCSIRSLSACQLKSTLFPHIFSWYIFQVSNFCFIQCKN